MIEAQSLFQLMTDLLGLWIFIIRFREMRIRSNGKKCYQMAPQVLILLALETRQHALRVLTALKIAENVTSVSGSFLGY